MSRRKTGPGRPGKGPRKAYMTRIATGYAEQIDNDAELADVSYSEYIAALVAIGLRHRDELPAALRPKEVLPDSA